MNIQMEHLQNCTLCGSDNIKTIDEQCNICRCLSCGFIFDNPRPKIGELINYYSAPAKYDSWLSEEYERDLLWKRRIKKILRHAKSGKLLDVGTGIGQFLHHAQKFFDVYGTEVSDSAVKTAKEKYDIHVIKSEIDKLETNISFDIVTLFHVLEHVPYPKAAVEKCRALLNDGGLLVIALPNELLSLRNRIKTRMRKLGIRLSSRSGVTGLPKIVMDNTEGEIHLSHFTQNIAAGLLKRTGFEIVENSLDPYFAKKGLSLFLNHLYYAAHYLLMKTFKINLYGSIWIIGRKKGPG